MTNSLKAEPTKATDDAAGTLFVVATPIGNLGDLSSRAIDTLKKVALILAEDTRHSKRLLNHYGISTPLKACHEHNETGLITWVTERLAAGEHLALISDAGTPLISDPGFVLVRALRERGMTVQAIPGASSIISALSIAGLPTDSFIYDGFLPAKAAARMAALKQYLVEHRTIVLLESSHRILACLADIVAVLGRARQVVLARELTKKFETVISGPASEVLSRLQQDENQCKGEFVLLLAGVPRATDQAELNAEVEATLVTLMADLPLKQAAALTAKLTGQRKNDVYQRALELREKDA